MDTFFEQIVAVRKTPKDWAAFIGIWLAALVLCGASVFLIGLLSSFAFLLIAGVLYGAFKLSTRLSIEYEYIVTNGTMDIDKIIAKSSRKRQLSFELSAVERLERYHPDAKPVGNFSKTVIACDENDPDAFFMVVSEEKKGTRLLVFAPEERMQQAIVKSLPKYIANHAFE
ncbi:MAG: hypothetical protein IKI29_07285 [Clostridia bacterium]|nr:hypothetical protein [Clostridia bacterium]